MKNDWRRAEKVLKGDGVAVIPTDTLYGLVGSVFSREAVEKIYKLKERDLNKALVVLISSYKDLEIFGIKIKGSQAKILREFWPGKVSVILACNNIKWKHIHRELNSIAFRMIGTKNKNLFNLIKNIGPIVAPSANKENFPPALTIEEAKKYFSDEISLYIDEGSKESQPSTMISLIKKEPEIIRQGEIKIKF